MHPEADTDFLLRRAEEEAILAIRNDQTPAAAPHRELSLRYSARAREALRKADAEPTDTRDLLCPMPAQS